MATLTIRNLDERVKGRLRVRAASHGRSMDEEAWQILRAALSDVEPTSTNLAERIRPFDTAAVPGHVEIVAIALCHGDRLANCNQSDFEGCSVSRVDRWAFAGQLW